VENINQQRNSCNF